MDREGGWSRVESKRLGDAPQLPHRCCKSDQNKATHNRRRASHDQGITEAKSIDRNAKSDRDKTRYRGHDPEQKKTNMHIFIVLCAPADATAFAVDLLWARSGSSASSSPSFHCAESTDY
jgi:hypothetical protein